MNGYYSSGEFAKKAHITKKTLRYYDEHNILKPSFVNNNGNRYYSESDFMILQQILFLKYLGFSLSDIQTMTLQSSNLKKNLNIQLGLLEERMEQLEVMKKTLLEAKTAVEEGNTIAWDKMMALVNTSELEQKLKKQYLNASNISARILLHEQCSQNPEKWFPWLYRQCSFTADMSVLELGCGDGSFWLENKDLIPSMSIVATDISSGLVRDLEKKLGDHPSFTFQVMDAEHINAPENSFDMVIANHVLFYIHDIEGAIKEIFRVLKPGGKLICSTYSASHMREISQLVSAFDDRIVLSAEKLYERFGKENGKEILSSYFQDASWVQYSDSLIVSDSDLLISYILSCHGNQNMYIVDRYKEFKAFVEKKMDPSFHITKDAGIFIARK